MKLADSLNPATQAENIKKLNAGLEAVDAKTLPATTSATTDQILKLTGENKTPSWADEYRYTPPAYSETEVNTGQKWIDGKDVYMLSGIVDVPELQTSSTVLIKTLPLNLFLIRCSVSIMPLDGSLITPYTSLYYYKTSTGNFSATNVGIFYSEGKILYTIYYTKPDPSPETRDDDTPEEVKETKTRKKTQNKKED